MNYIKELNAFRDWMLLNDLPTSAIALWHTLMTINNMTGWKERFNAPNSTVEKLTGLSKQGVADARMKLKEKGLIEYEKGKKGKAPIYKMLSLVNSPDQYLDQSDDQDQDQSDDESLNTPEEEQKQKEDEDNNVRVNPFTVFEQEGFGTISGFTAERIGDLIDDYSEESVIAAMKEAVLHGARNLKYVEAILKNPNKNSNERREKNSNAKKNGTANTLLENYDFGTRFG